MLYATSENAVSVIMLHPQPERVLPSPVFSAENRNIFQFFRKNYLQNGLSSIIMIRHGIFPVVNQHHTPGDRSAECPLGGRCEMIGVEAKTKGENLKWLSYL